MLKNVFAFVLFFIAGMPLNAQPNASSNYKKRYLVAIYFIYHDLAGTVAEMRPFLPGDDPTRLISHTDENSLGISFVVDKRINSYLAITSKLGYYFLKGKTEIESVNSVLEIGTRIERYYNFDFVTHYLTNGYHLQLNLTKSIGVNLKAGGAMSLQFAGKKEGRQTLTFVDFTQSPPIRLVQGDREGKKIGYDFLRLQLFGQFGVNRWIKWNKQERILLELMYGLPLLQLSAPMNLRSRLLSFSLNYKFREWKR